MSVASHRRPGPTAYLLIVLFAFALALLPFLFWYQTWFGRKLTDAQIDSYFADRSHPRRAQHALVQVGERMARKADVSRWYPNVMQQAASPRPELRETAAWIMGQDSRYAPFHSTLLELIHDREPLVRRNAALALAAFGDPAARAELRSMLQPVRILAPASGVLKWRVKPGEYVNPGTLLARIGGVEIRSPLPGEAQAVSAEDGSRVQAGDRLTEIAPDKDHVWEALRALYLVGEPGDLDEVQRFTRPIPGMPDNVRRQAEAAVEAIRARTSAP